MRNWNREFLQTTAQSGSRVLIMAVVFVIAGILAEKNHRSRSRENFAVAQTYDAYEMFFHCLDERGLCAVALGARGDR